MEATVDACDIGRGVRLFLDGHGAASEALLKAFASDRRLKTVEDGGKLCLVGEDADCVWIVEEGHFRIELGSLVARRGPGELIGEMAFFRGGATSAKRGNNVVADGRSTVWRIDRATLDGLSPADRALWLEAVARTLVSKLDEASEQRDRYAHDLAKSDRSIRRLVCPEGMEATSALLASDGNEIATVMTKAVIWFSDLVNFSTVAEGRPAADVGIMLRRLLKPQVAAIEAAGGQIDKHMGDGLMAFWLGPDEARLDRAVAAATRAALDAVSGVRRAAAGTGVAVGIRIGLHVGEVAIGDFGAGERIAFTLVGSAVNTAARFEQHKPAKGEPDGAVRISAAVHERLSDDLRDDFGPKPIEIVAKHDRRFAAYLSAI